MPDSMGGRIQERLPPPPADRTITCRMMVWRSACSAFSLSSMPGCCSSSRSLHSSEDCCVNQREAIARQSKNQEHCKNRGPRTEQNTARAEHYKYVFICLMRCVSLNIDDDTKLQEVRGASMCGGSNPHSHGCNALIHNSERQEYNSPRQNIEICACLACVISLRATSMSHMSGKQGGARTC